MAHGLKNPGEQFIIKHIFTNGASKPPSIEIGLFHDASDALGDNTDLADILSEPTDGAYARLTYDFGPTDFTGGLVNGDWQAEFATKTFGLQGTTGTADAFFVVLPYQAEGDSAQSDHLFMTAALEDTNGNAREYDLGSIDEADFDGTFSVQ